MLPTDQKRRYGDDEVEGVRSGVDDGHGTAGQEELANLTLLTTLKVFSRPSANPS